MPAKAPLDENVKFLFSCLLRSDYKTIDFNRVAADFSINPAAARMRWSRLKKTISPDDQSIFFTAESPKKKGAKWPPKQLRDPKEVREIVREIHKEKRAERKAKIRAEQKIGVVVKGEAMTEEEVEEEEGEIEGSGPESKDLGMAQTENDGEQQAPEQDIIKTEERGIPDIPLTPQTQEEDIFNTPQTAESNFGLFQISPATTSFLPSFPLSPNSSQILASEVDDEAAARPWSPTITVKYEADPNFDITAFTSSPNSTSSFSPVSSTRTSPSPPAHVAEKPERAPQKWRAINTKAHETRGRPRKDTSDDMGTEF